MAYRKFTGLLFLLFLFLTTASFQKREMALLVSTAKVKVTFKNTVKNSNIVLYDSVYTNPFGEKFTINKFRYYVSNISFGGARNTFGQTQQYYLIDEKIPESQTIELEVPPGKYSSIYFLLGVDSLHNVSGAQSGALDPINDMFWTWNTGYVMAKLEGNSPASTLVNHKYEYHIGGYAGKYNVLKNIEMAFPGNRTIHLKKGETVEIIINADVNTWWQYPNEIKIATHPAINSPGKQALAMSGNYAGMFTIQKIINHH